MKLAIAVLAATLLFQSTVFAAGLQLALDDAAHSYDVAQRSFEKCVGAHPYDEPEDWHVVTSGMNQDDLNQMLQDYKDAHIYLDEKIAACQADPSNPPQACWGFWPADDRGELHWKMMPCE